MSKNMFKYLSLDEGKNKNDNYDGRPNNHVNKVDKWDRFSETKENNASIRSANYSSRAASREDYSIRGTLSDSEEYSSRAASREDYPIRGTLSDSEECPYPIQ